MILYGGRARVVYTTRMKILDRISELPRTRGLGFVLIGGHAINAMAERRHTRDIDIAARAARADEWREVLLSMGYKLLHESDAFLQFAPPTLGEWPLDVMLVNESTFAKLDADAAPTDVGGEYHVKVASARHLVAMKLHALKQSGGRLKDMADIVMLIGGGEIDVAGPDFRAMCLKHADEGVYEEIVKHCGREASGG